MESNECFGVGLLLVTLSVTSLNGWNCKNGRKFFRERDVAPIFVVTLTVIICNLSVTTRRDRQEREKFLLTCKLVQTREINGLQAIKSDALTDCAAVWK